MTSTHPLHEGRARAQPVPARRDWVALLLSIWESEGVLSIRLITANLVTLFGLAVQWWALHAAGLSQETRGMIEHFVDADFIFAGSLFGLGVGKVALSRFSPKPNIDPTEQLKSDATGS